MEPKVLTKDSFTVVGPQLATLNDGTNLKAIPLFWRDYMDKKTAAKIPHKAEPWREYGVCGDMMEGSKCFVYMIGEEVTKVDVIPPGMVARTIPSALYAVFTAKGPIPEAIQEMVRYAYGTWLPQSKEYARAETEDFELYDERCTRAVPEVDIYIPIKKK
jgi:AraC family transcriptional regulator